MCVHFLCTEEVQGAATGALAQLAENPTCQQMIAGAGALAPLMKLTTYGNDMARLGSMAALDVLSVNNPLVHQVYMIYVFSTVNPDPRKEEEHARINFKNRRVCFSRYFAVNNAPFWFHRSCWLRAHRMCCRDFPRWDQICYANR